MRQDTDWPARLTLAVGAAWVLALSGCNLLFPYHSARGDAALGEDAKAVDGKPDSHIPGYRRAITVPSGQMPTGCVPSDLPLLHFPLLVVTENDYALRTVAQGGHVADPKGADIVFHGSDGTTPLDFEIEQYNGSAGTLVAWVSIPSLPITGRPVAYLEYGNPRATASTRIPPAVWDQAGYTGVWHLSDETSADGTGGSIHDSTSTLADGTPSGTVYAAGIIGGAQSFHGSARIDLKNPSQLNFDDKTSFTYSCWVKVEGQIVGIEIPWWKGASTPNDLGYDIELGDLSWRAQVSRGVQKWVLS